MSTAIYHGMLDDVRQAQKGDEAAFTRLVNKTKNTVTSIALAIVKDIDASEDIAQQVYIKSWQNLSSLKSTTSFLPWLRQMTRNFACNFIRDNRVNQQIIGADAEKILAEYSCESDRQQEQLERSQLSVIISDLIEQLPEDSREMILLYYREEQSAKQVANLLEVNEVLVRKRLSRVRQQLKPAILEKYGQIILSTAPSLTFSTLIMTSLASFSPGAAAMAASNGPVMSNSWLANLLSPLGAFFIAIGVAIGSVWWGAGKQINSVSDEQAKRVLRAYRLQIVAWVLLCAALIYLTFEYSFSQTVKMLVITVYLVGCLYLVFRSNIFYDRKKYGNRELTNGEQRSRLFFWSSSIAGALFGSALGIYGVLKGLSVF